MFMFHPSYYSDSTWWRVVAAEEAAALKAENAKQQSEADQRMRSLNEIRVDVDMASAEVRRLYRSL